MLFDKKGLLASSIAHYRSALSVPLRIVLKIDILNSIFSGLIKAMSLLRPSKTFTAPSWNLQIVLGYLEGLPARILYEDTLDRAIVSFYFVLSGEFRNYMLVLNSQVIVQLLPLVH